MLYLNIRAAHQLVREQSRLGNDVRWDNYDLVFFKPYPGAWANPRGVFRARGSAPGRWGFETRVPVNSTGLWEVDPKDVKHSRHIRRR